MKFSGRVGRDPRTNQLDSDGDPDQDTQPEFFFYFPARNILVTR